MSCAKKANLTSCNCTYEPCPRKGICCECVRFHLAMRELPACAFDERGERTYDRSFEHFAALLAEGRL
jgi:Domain of unknown function (DUF6485)